MPCRPAATNRSSGCVDHVELLELLGLFGWSFIPGVGGGAGEVRGVGLPESTGGQGRVDGLTLPAAAQWRGDSRLVHSVKVDEGTSGFIFSLNAAQATQTD